MSRGRGCLAKAVGPSIPSAGSGRSSGRGCPGVGGILSHCCTGLCPFLARGTPRAHRAPGGLLSLVGPRAEWETVRGAGMRGDAEDAEGSGSGGSEGYRSWGCSHAPPVLTPGAEPAFASRLPAGGAHLGTASAAPCPAGNTHPGSLCLRDAGSLLPHFQEREKKISCSSGWEKKKRLSPPSPPPELLPAAEIGEKAQK